MQSAASNHRQPDAKRGLRVCIYDTGQRNGTDVRRQADAVKWSVRPKYEMRNAELVDEKHMKTEK